MKEVLEKLEKIEKRQEEIFEKISWIKKQWELYDKICVGFVIFAVSAAIASFITFCSR